MSELSRKSNEQNFCTFFYFIFLSVSVVGMVPSASYGDQLCVRNRVPVRNNTLRLGNFIQRFEGDCPARFRAIPDPTPVPTPTPSPEPEPQKTVSFFATFDSDGDLLSSGGDSLESVTATRVATGIFDITALGEFRNLSEEGTAADIDKLAIVATAGGLLNRGVSWFPLAASRAEVRIRALVWDAQTGNLSNPNLSFSIAVFGAE